MLRTRVIPRRIYPTGLRTPFASGRKWKSSTTPQGRSYDYYRKENESWFWGGGKRKKNAGPTLSARERNIAVAWYMAAVAVGGLGATYAAVPLYKVFCQTTGFGGTTQRIGNGWDIDSIVPASVQKFIRYWTTKFFPRTARVHTWTDEEAAQKLATLKPVENAQLMTVYFDTTVTDSMPWSFRPVQREVKVVPGETALSFFQVTNHSDKAITGVATYNVYPSKVGLYFQKVQCFCFEEQRLLPGETVDMPVFFFIDPEILDDPQIGYVTDMTLSYTFFQTDEEDDDDDDDEDDEE